MDLRDIAMMLQQFESLRGVVLHGRLEEMWRWTNHMIKILKAVQAEPGAVLMDVLGPLLNPFRCGTSIKSISELLAQ